MTGAVADAVKRGESYSSRTDFLTDESVERMAEAVIAEAAEALGLADADDTAPTRETIRDSNVAALKDKLTNPVIHRGGNIIACFSKRDMVQYSWRQ